MRAKRRLTAIFYSTHGGQIVANMLGGFSKNYFTKSMISRGSLGRFWWKQYTMELRYHSLIFWKREVQENSIARERPRSRSGMMTIFLENCSLSRCFRYFVKSRMLVKILDWHMKFEQFFFLAALPGAQRREGASPARSDSTWLVETEKSEAPSYSNTL